jgi:hypothetical protein
MRHRTAWILGVILLSLVFHGESCVTEQRDVSAIFGIGIPAEWSTEGYTDTSDRDTVDVAAKVKAAIDDGAIDIDKISKIYVAGGCYEVDLSKGHDARRYGSVHFNVAGDPQHHFLDFDVPTNVTGTKGNSGDGTLTLQSDGVTYLDGVLNNYLAQLQGGFDPPLLVYYDAQWTSDPAPTQADPDSFYWHVCVNLQIDYKVETEIPAP